MKRFTNEFKHKAVEVYLSRGKDVTVADELGVGRSTLKKWERAFRDELNPVLVNEAEELRRLRKDNARLQEEVEILKKAAAFFAQDQLPRK